MVSAATKGLYLLYSPLRLSKWYNTLTISLETDTAYMTESPIFEDFWISTSAFCTLSLLYFDSGIPVRTKVSPDICFIVFDCVLQFPHNKFLVRYTCNIICWLSTYTYNYLRNTGTRTGIVLVGWENQSRAPVSLPLVCWHDESKSQSIGSTH